MDKTTHFGYKKVDSNKKQKLVDDVFDSVANNYDLMNDLMSFGMHRFWKKYTTEISGINKNDVVLDLAGGTGDMAYRFSKIIGPKGRLILCDINNSMLTEGRKKLIDKGVINIDFIQANAEKLPFKENHFDCVNIAFGLRNVTDKELALKQIYKILKKGGRLLILEFSKINNKALSKLYDFYSFSIIPKIGHLITKDKDSYQYLSESICQHPSQKLLKEMVHKAGFKFCEYHNLSQGIVAVHKAIKI